MSARNRFYPAPLLADELSESGGLHAGVEDHFALAIRGFPPSSTYHGADGDYFGALDLSAYAEHARGLMFALDGTREDGEVPTPSGPHAHDESAQTALAWCQIGSWRLCTGLGEGAGFVTDSLTLKDAATIYVAVPEAITRVVLRARVFLVPDSQAAGTVRLELRDLADLNDATPALTQTLTTPTTAKPADFGTGGIGFWLETSELDFSGFASVGGLRVALLRVDTKVDEVDATLELREIQCGACYSYNGEPEPTDPGLAEDLSLANEPLPATTLERFLITNPERLRARTFGGLRGFSAPHDHGAAGGATLARAVGSWVLGPHVPEGGGALLGGEPGLPLWPSNGAAFSLTNPKLLATLPLFVQGGIAEIDLRAVCELFETAPRAATLRLEARPRSEVGRDMGAGVVAGVTLNFTDNGDDYTEATGTLDLSGLGSVGEDRLFELCVYQASDQDYSGAGGDRFLCLLALPGDAPASVPERDTDQPRETLSRFLIRRGQELSEGLLSKGARVLNQVTREILGGVPGLSRDLATPNTADPWRRELCAPHQHRGSYLDSHGTQVDDGAIVRLPLLLSSCVRNVAGGAELVEGVSTSANARGVLLDGLTLHGRVSIPQGLASVEVYALVQPETTDPMGRLWCTANVRAANTQSVDASIVTGARCGQYRARGTVGAAGVSCLLEPEESPAIWESHRDRARLGLGSWTQDALRVTPASDADSTYPARWSRALVVDISPTHTGDYLISVAFELQIERTSAPGSAGPRDENARLLAWAVLPGRAA